MRLKKFFLLGVFLLGFFVMIFNFTSVSASGGWYNDDWQHRIQITINSDKVPEDLTDFPIYVNLSALPSGFHTNVKSDGEDIRMTMSDGTTEIPREVVFYNSVTDTGELWFKGNLSSITDSVFYIYYGNPSASDYAVTDTYGRNKVWNNYLAVLHMAETPTGSAGDIINSVGSNNFTSVNMESGDRIDGKFTYALNFGGIDEYLNLANALITTTPHTFSAWVKIPNVDASSIAIASIGDTASADYESMLYVSSGTTPQWAVSALTRGTAPNEIANADTAITEDAWFLAHGVWSATDNRIAYFNGGNSGSNTVSKTYSSYDTTRVGNRANLDGGLYITGLISEVRISATALSSTWISTEYSNQNSPSTFYSVGSEESQESSPPPTIFDWINLGNNLYYLLGNIGIGTANPAQKLDVAGNIQISEGSAFMQDGQNVIKLAKGTDTFYANTIVGAEAGNSTALRQTALGYSAGYQNTGVYQTALGYYAGYQNTGASQTALGYYASFYNSGSYQTALGYFAGSYNTGSYQTALGYYAGSENTGSSQTALGYSAGSENTGSSQTALGYSAGFYNLGHQVIGLGFEATRSNSGNDTIAIGYQAGKSNTLNNQFIIKQANINAIPLIQGNFSSGNVGIGTTSPQNKLNVMGVTNSTGGFAVNKNVGLTGNYSTGNCWMAYSGGIMYSTNCTINP